MHNFSYSGKTKIESKNTVELLNLYCVGIACSIVSINSALRTSDSINYCLQCSMSLIKLEMCVCNINYVTQDQSRDSRRF